MAVKQYMFHWDNCVMNWIERKWKSISTWKSRWTVNTYFCASSEHVLILHYNVSAQASRLLTLPPSLMKISVASPPARCSSTPARPKDSGESVSSTTVSLSKPRCLRSSSTTLWWAPWSILTLLLWLSMMLKMVSDVGDDDDVAIDNDEVEGNDNINDMTMVMIIRTKMWMKRRMK